jgi:hypothetical protein
MKEESKNPVTTALAEQNVTQQVLAKLKQDFLPLVINGIEDKIGYKRVHDARIQCRDLRTLSEKICKKGREESVQIQKAWIAKEKEVVAQISEIEQHLKKQEDAIDAIIEAQKIRAERLLKLPGRKDQVKGIEVYIGELTDDQFMRFDDAQWNEIIVIAQGKKLAAQQKEIDDAKTLARMNLIADRENALYKIAGASMQIKNGVKTFFKGNVSITEKEMGDMENDVWNIRFGEIATAIVSIPSEKTGVSYKPGVTARIEPVPEISEISDEEKLFNFASALENVSVPIMKTEVGKETLALATKDISKVIYLLRK